MQIGGIERHAGVLQPRDASLDAGAETEMELDIRRPRIRIGVPEAAGLEQARGHRAGAEEHILQAGP
ncbi:hypothetical protein D3C72_1922750 [compost metagenome]